MHMWKVDSENFYSGPGTVEIGALDQRAKGGMNRNEITSKEEWKSTFLFLTYWIFYDVKMQMSQIGTKTLVPSLLNLIVLLVR